MTDYNTQIEAANCPDTYQSLSFQLLSDTGTSLGELPVMVKNLTTAGLILEILDQPEGLKFEVLKGHEGLLTVINRDHCIVLKVPGKILWTRNREDEAGMTLGVELVEPLPLVVRQSLEANMTIGAKDMKVLWDYWDEVQASPDAAVTARDEAPAGFQQNAPPILAAEGEPQSDAGRCYYFGLGIILIGLIMQYPQSELLGLSGLGAMFLGSLLIAWRSLTSMWQMSSSQSAD